MVRLFTLALAACFYLQPGITFAQDAAKQLVGTWKLTSAPSTFDAGDTIEGFGTNPKGRLVITSDGHWIVIITRSDRSPAKNSDDKAALLDSMLAYSGRYTIDGDRITNRIDITHNEMFTGALQNQTRFFSVEGDKLGSTHWAHGKFVQARPKSGQHSHLGARALRIRLQ